MALAFALVIVKVSTEVPPMAIGLGANAFENVGRASTASVSLAAATLLPALAVVRPPAGIVLTRLPAVVGVTFTVTVHEPFAGMVPPESATDAPLLAAVTVPEQPAPLIVP